MKVEEIIKEKFIKALEENKKAICSSPYVGAEVAINRVSKRPYRGINVLFLHGEYASFKQWGELGYKCEKGKSEIAFFNSKVNYTPKDENGNPETDKDGKPIIKQGWILRFYNVWERHNVRDEKGEIAPAVRPEKEADKTPPTEAEANATAALHAYMDANGIAYTEDAINLAYFMPSANRIHLPAEMTSERERVLTLAHECAHSTGAKHLLDRKFGNAYSPSKEAYSREELIAETASAIFCGEKGVNVDIDNSVAYLQNWAKYLHDTPAKTIITAIYQAQKASRLLNGEPLESVKGKAADKDGETETQTTDAA